ncbi:OmpA family protein [uncultured Maribacter sp.]|uniref:OmpA family protein n=1 Tax=uncultured Maribacter sp. TaxID=431308 RepID=UPI0030EBD9DF|tara:strand:- start:29449 stop:31233 length:1785 start_codon:yes stop_codon:yes gene_type:complete
MKNYIILLIVTLLVISCGEDHKNEKISDGNSEINLNEDNEQINITSDDLKKSMEQLGGFLNLGGEDESSDKNSPEANALKKLLQMSGAGDQGTNEIGAFEDMLKSEAILDLLEASGVSREEMQKLINDPDSLRILAQEAIKNRQIEQQNEPELKGKISKEQLTSKNTPTGVSLEEAILMVQAESGPEATMAKLKTIDSLAGTNVMEQLNLTEAGYVMKDIERKNEAPPSAEEELKMEKLRKLAGQLHSVKEADQVLADLEKTENDISSGTLKASPKYQQSIAYRKKIVKIFQRDFARKAKAAKDKFQKLNPNLYFGEEAGETYVGHMKKAVYLPLGKLSFADNVVKSNHPLLLTQEVNNVLGEPDVLQGFDVEDITGIHSLGLGGSITVQFTNNALTDVNGPDLYIFEIGQIEPTNLEISKEGKKWIHVGKIDGGVAEVDISPFVKQGELFYYVRLTDLKQESGLPGADVDAIAAIGAAMRLNLDSKVLFETGKSVLKREGLAALKELAQNIAVLKKGNVIVEGHTDDVGGSDTNQKLSLARAKSVSNELKKLIPSTGFRWKEVGLGELKPLVENDSEENKAKNRRVEVLVVPN